MAENEDQLICYCFRVTKREIINAIQKYNLKNTDQVTRAIRAGGGCRTCRFDIEPLITKYANPEKQSPNEEELNEIQIYNRTYKILNEISVKKELEEKNIRVDLDSIEGTQLFMNFFSTLPGKEVQSDSISWLEDLFRKKLHPRICIQKTSPASDLFP
ncbi:MAG: (2Fe-2S)-binding protein [Planctomycetota bacterium]